MQNPNEKSSNTSNPSNNTKQLKLDPNIRLDGTPLYVLRGITRKKMESLFFLANYLYEERKYEEACPLFQLIAFLDNQDKRAWHGAAVCLQAMKEYQKAVACYGALAFLDLKDPMPFFHMFHCHLENHDKTKAINALNAAIEVASKEEGRYADLQAQAMKIKEALLQ